MPLYNGELEGYSSQSEADMALCSILSFYSGGDNYQVDRLFRSSKLFRSKWDEKRGTMTYGKMTVDLAVSSQSSIFKPIESINVFEDFSNEYRRFESYMNENITNYSLNTISAGNLFADFFKETLRFVPERKSWFYNKDGIWRKDEEGLRAIRSGIQIADYQGMMNFKEIAIQY